MIVPCEPASALSLAQRYLRDLTIAQVQAQLASWGEDASDAEVDEGVRPYADPAFWAAYALIGGVAPVSTAI